MSPEIRLASVSTKRGDGGLTDTVYGRETKDHASIELNGIFDEFQAVLGVAAARLGNDKNGDFLKSEQIIQDLMGEVYIGLELDESIDIEKLKEKMTNNEISDLVRLCDEGSEISKLINLLYQDKGYFKYFLNLKEKLSNKISIRTNFDCFDPKTDIQNSFNIFFDSTEKVMSYMKDDSELKEEVKKINENLKIILGLVNEDKNDFDFGNELKSLEDLEGKLEKNNFGMSGGFKLFGNDLKEAYLNLSRTRVRRIERRVVSWNGYHDQKLFKTSTLAYLNRASDVLYLMSIKKN